MFLNKDYTLKPLLLLNGFNMLYIETISLVKWFQCCEPINIGYEGKIDFLNV
jgi:hypothetical protein